MIIISKTLPKILSFGLATGITIYPFAIVNKNNEVLINHEKIHLQQQREWFVVLFFVIYFLNYIINLLIYRNHRKAYHNIFFEKEAFDNEADLNYLNNRKIFNRF